MDTLDAMSGGLPPALAWTPMQVDMRARGGWGGSGEHCWMGYPVGHDEVGGLGGWGGTDAGGASWADDGLGGGGGGVGGGEAVSVDPVVAWKARALLTMHMIERMQLERGHLVSALKKLVKEAMRDAERVAWPCGGLQSGSEPNM